LTVSGHRLRPVRVGIPCPPTRRAHSYGKQTNRVKNRIKENYKTKRNQKVTVYQLIRNNRKYIIKRKKKENEANARVTIIAKYTGITKGNNANKV